MNDNTRPITRRRLLDAGPHQGLLDAYGRHLAGTGLSPVSVHIHQGSARHFLAWLLQSNIAFDQVGPDIASQFAGHECKCHSAPRRLAHVTLATAIWMQTMVPLTAGDTVELQGYFRVADGYFAADHTSFWGCKVG